MAGTGAGTPVHYEQTVGGSGAWDSIQLAWTCDVMSGDILQTLDPLKLEGTAGANSFPDAKTLLDYSPEGGALRMWSEAGAYTRPILSST